jgi:hypothetical protein
VKRKSRPAELRGASFGRFLSAFLNSWIHINEKNAKMGGEMDKNYFFDGTQTGRMVSDNELFKTDYNVAITNRSPFLILIDKNTAKKGDRRAHQRFQVKKDAFAMIRPVSVKQIPVADRSMAEIACAVYRSKPTQFGRINNISMDGLSFNYIAGEEESSPSLVLDILLADCAFYLPNLTFKTICDFQIDADFSMDPIKMRRHHVQFERQAPAQIRKMQYFIQHYSCCVE